LNESSRLAAFRRQPYSRRAVARTGSDLRVCSRRGWLVAAALGAALAGHLIARAFFSSVHRGWPRPLLLLTGVEERSFTASSLGVIEALCEGEGFAWV
jgi:hypothetical protein